MMAKQLEEQRDDFLLDVRAAVKRNQVVVMILYNAEEGEYLAMSNRYGIEYRAIRRSGAIKNLRFPHVFHKNILRFARL